MTRWSCEWKGSIVLFFSFLNHLLFETTGVFFNFFFSLCSRSLLSFSSACFLSTPPSHSPPSTRYDNGDSPSVNDPVQATLYLLAGAENLIDFEIYPTLDVTYGCIDNGFRDGASDGDPPVGWMESKPVATSLQQITVTIVDQNEPPFFTTGLGSSGRFELEVDEGSDLIAVTENFESHVTCRDVDAKTGGGGDTTDDVTLVLKTSAGSVSPEFTITADTCVPTTDLGGFVCPSDGMRTFCRGSIVKPSGTVSGGGWLPDFETKQVYDLTITATDEGGLSFDLPIRITVRDKNDSPMIVRGSSTTCGGDCPRTNLATAGPWKVSEDAVNKTKVLSSVAASGETMGICLLQSNTFDTDVVVKIKTSKMNSSYGAKAGGDCILYSPSGSGTSIGRLKKLDNITLLAHRRDLKTRLAKLLITNDNGTKDVGGDDGFHHTLPKQQRQRRSERNSQLNKSSHKRNSKHVFTDPALNKQSLPVLADGRDSSPRLGSNSNGNGAVQPERMGRKKLSESSEKKGGSGGDGDGSVAPAVPATSAGSTRSGSDKKDVGAKDVGDDGFLQPVETVPFPLSAAKQKLNRLKALHKERRQRRRERNSQLNKSSHGNDSKHVPTDPALNIQSLPVLADGRDSSPRLGSNNNSNGAVQSERMDRTKLSESSKKKGGGGSGDGSAAPAVTATSAGSTRSGSNTFKRKEDGTKDVSGDDDFHQPVETVPFPLSAAKQKLNRLKALHKERRQRRRERNSQLNKSSHGNDSKHVPTDPASNKQSLADGRASSPRLHVGSNSKGNGAVQPERIGSKNDASSRKGLAFINNDMNDTNEIGKDGTAKVKQVLNPSATKLKRTFKRGKRKERRAGSDNYEPDRTALLNRSGSKNLPESSESNDSSGAGDNDIATRKQKQDLDPLATRFKNGGRSKIKSFRRKGRAPPQRSNRTTLLDTSGRTTFSDASVGSIDATSATLADLDLDLDAGGITVSKSIVENETVQINHGIQNKDTTNPKILQTNGSLQTNLSRTNSRRKTNSTLNENGYNRLSKFNRDTLKSLNGTNDDTNCKRPKERRPFKSNGKPNKSFSGVDAAAQRASIEHYLKNVKFRFVESEVFQCIKMSLGLFGMGCFVLVMCFVIPWVDLNLHSLLVYRRWYWFSIRERRRWWKKKKEKGPSFKIGRSYGHRFKAYLPVKWVLSLFIVASELGVGADAYAKMPDGCLGKSWRDRSCYPRKAVDELNADGSGTHPTYGPMKDWDMSEVTDITNLFYDKGSMNANLSSWDVSRVTNMESST